MLLLSVFGFFVCLVGCIYTFFVIFYLIYWLLHLLACVIFFISLTDCVSRGLQFGKRQLVIKPVYKNGHFKCRLRLWYESQAVVLVSWWFLRQVSCIVGFVYSLVKNFFSARTFWQNSAGQSYVSNPSCFPSVAEEVMVAYAYVWRMVRSHSAIY